MYSWETNTGDYTFWAWMEDDGGDDPVPVEYSFNGIKYKTTIHSGDDEMGETAVWRSSSKDAIHTTGKFEFVVKWK